MPKRIEYKKGEILNGLVYLCDVENYISPNGKMLRKAKFKCYCGNEFESVINSVKRKITNSCGCYNQQRRIETQTKHGLSEHWSYWVWASMKYRCNIGHKNYGKKAIQYHSDWEKFEPFFNYVSRLPKFHKAKELDLSIDRIDNDGNYTYGNLRWATRQQQELNKGLSIRNNSGALGVGWMPHISKWRARFKDVYIGSFTNKQDAINARFNYLKDNNYG